MNERIKELMEQTGIHVYKQSVLDKHYPELYDGVYCELSVEELEKFAELIVEECVQVGGPEDSYRDEWFNAKADSVNKIKKHFGVE